MQDSLCQWVVLAAAGFSATVNAGAAGQATSPTPADPERLTLDAAERLFREHSLELLAAKRAVESAGADRVIAAQRPNPTLSIGASSLSATNWSAASGFRDKPVDTGIQLSQLIERGDKRQFRTDAAQSNLAAGRSDLQDGSRCMLCAMRSTTCCLLRSACG